MAFLSRLRKVFGFINLGIGSFMLFLFLWPTLFERAGSEDYSVFLFFASWFLAAFGGFMVNNRWIVVLTAMPIISLAAVYAFIFAIGGAFWGPSNEGTVNLLILSCITIILLEIVGVVVAFVSPREPGAGQQ
jgi:hypothetical protein